MQRLRSFFGRAWGRLFPAPPAAPLAVQRELLALLLQKTGPLRILSPIPFAAPLAWVFWQASGSGLPLLWLGLFCAAVAATYVRRRRLQAHGPLRDPELAPILRGRVRDIALLGGLWGLAPWLLASQGGEALVLVSIFVVGAVSLGSAIVSTHRSTIAAFSAPAALGMVSACAWHGGVVGWVLAACMALFLFMTLTWTFQQADLLQDSLTVRVEKETLAERLAQQVALVEAADREKSRFLAAASHDLRQPLQAISLFTAVLERSALPADSAQTVAQLGHSLRLLHQSLDGMLDISRLDAGAVPARRESLCLHELLLALHHSFSGPAQAKDLQLRVRAPGALRVLSDADLLTRLLGNLIDNAIKYTVRGGVLVAARPGARWGRPGWVCLEVVDTGIGIAPAHQQQVFDEFFQLANPQRDRALGLGIGLSIVQRLASLLGHALELSSRPGRGTRCRVWLPEGAAPFAAAPAAAQTEARAALPRQVLVVDDEALGRQAMGALLSACGCVVHLAGDLAQAECLLGQHAIEAVVADFRLAGERSGLAFLQDLRAQAPGLRSLLVTGETSAERIAEIRASGLPFLHKPVRAAELLDALAG